jgi:alpha-beta hydrolase superfamily lysophospholipase
MKVRHFFWFVLLAGLTYVSLPFFYAADYTWKLLHPVCQESEIDGIEGRWVELTHEKDFVFNYWFVEPENGRILMLVGGRGGRLSDWQHEVEAFVKLGYGVVVLPDPGCNLSTATLGIAEKNQIVAVADDLNANGDAQWIGAVGFSAGASALALAVPQTDEINAVILLGNFADLQSEILYTPYPAGSVGWLGQHGVPFWYWVFTGYRVIDVNPMAAFSAYGNVDVLLIHGEYEVERTQAEKQLDVLQGYDHLNAELWIVPEAVHGMYYDAAGDEYLLHLLEFIDGNGG